MKINHIIDSQWRHLLIQELTKDQPILFNQHFKSFRQAFFPYDAKEIIKRFNHAFILLQAYRETLTELSASLVYPLATQQLLDFIDECDQYQIDLSTFTPHTSIDEERIKLALYLSNEINYRPFLHPRQIENPIVYPQYLNLFQQDYLSSNYIVQKNAPSTKPTIHAYQALNSRQEIEALAQMIINEQIESLVILVGDLDHYSQEIKRIFSTYQIPVTLSYQEYPTLFLVYYHLVMFSLTKESEHLSAYQNLTNQNLPENMDNLSLSELLAAAYQVVRETANSQQLQVLKQRIESLVPILDSPYFTTLFEYHLLQPMSVNTPPASIIVTDYRSVPPLPVDRMVILGLTTQSYPAFTPKQGLINEEFLKKIDLYPPLEQRVAFHKQQMEAIFTRSHELILSFPLMDYEGNPNEKPLVVDDMKLSFRKWPIIEAVTRPLSIRKLPEDLASRLFFKEGQLRGSISSFETYFKNSYQYFIERGIRVKRPRSNEPDEALMGTINHEVMEHLVESEPDYIHASDETIMRHLIETYQKYLGDEPFHHFLLLRNLEQIKLVLKKLTNYEDKSPYRTLGHEQRFSNYTKLLSDERILINGIVDRIDGNDSEMIVLDYKSSDQSLPPKQVLNGQKLQLITYGMIISELEHKQLVGAYYINMRSKYLNYQLSDYSMRDGLVDGKSLSELAQSENRLKGISFHVPQTHPLLEELRVKYQKNGKIVGLYDFEKTKAYFTLIYEHLYRALLQGDIARYQDSELSKYFEMKDLQRVKQHRFNNTSFTDYEGIDEDFSLVKGNES